MDDPSRLHERLILQAPWTGLKSLVRLGGQALCNGGLGEKVMRKQKERERMKNEGEGSERENESGDPWADRKRLPDS
jgi:hypothetical protein